jgi:hypothetical protein
LKHALIRRVNTSSLYTLGLINVTETEVRL